MLINCPHCHGSTERQLSSPAWKLGVVLIIVAAMPLGFMLLLTGPLAPVLVLFGAICCAAALGPAISKATASPECSNCGRVLA